MLAEELRCPVYVPDVFHGEPWPEGKPVEGNKDEFERWRCSIGGVVRVQCTVVNAPKCIDMAQRTLAPCGRFRCASVGRVLSGTCLQACTEHSVSGVHVAASLGACSVLAADQRFMP